MATETEMETARMTMMAETKAEPLIVRSTSPRHRRRDIFRRTQNTPDEYLDSFGSDPPSKHGSWFAWTLAGLAKEKWSEEGGIFDSICIVLDHGARRGRLDDSSIINIVGRMIGKNKKTAVPSALLGCQDRQCARDALGLLAKRDFILNAQFHVRYELLPDLRALGGISPSPFDDTGEKIVYSSTIKSEKLYNIPITIKSPDQPEQCSHATMGGVFSIHDDYFGLTTAHALLDHTLPKHDPRSVGSHSPSSSLGAASLMSDDFWSEYLSEDEFLAAELDSEDEMSSDADLEDLEDPTADLEPSFSFLPEFKLGQIFQKPGLFKPELDWALVSLVDEVQDNFRAGNLAEPPTQLITNMTKFEPYEGQIFGRHGNGEISGTILPCFCLLKLRTSTNVVRAYEAVLEQTPLVGASGSWVYCGPERVLGVMVAANQRSKTVYVIPAFDVFLDISKIHGAPVQVGRTKYKFVDSIVPPMKIITVKPQRNRVVQMCDWCRSNKVRCDRVTPRCSRCASLGIECRTRDNFKIEDRQAEAREQILEQQQKTQPSPGPRSTLGTRPSNPGADDPYYEPLKSRNLQQGGGLGSRDQSSRELLAWGAGRESEIEVQSSLQKNAIPRDIKGAQSLLSAAEAGDEDSVTLQIGAGAQLEETDHLGRTALLSAVEMRNAAIVKLLIEAGARVNAVDSLNQTALLLAARSGYAVIVELLIEAGAQLEAMDRYRRTALLLAAGNGHALTVELLLVAGADLKSVDEFGQTALSMAESGDHQDTLFVIREMEAGGHKMGSALVRLVSRMNKRFGIGGEDNPFLIPGQRPGHQSWDQHQAKLGSGQPVGLTPPSIAVRHTHHTARITHRPSITVGRTRQNITQEITSSEFDPTSNPSPSGKRKEEKREKQVLDRQKEVHSEGDPDSLRKMSSLASNLFLQGRLKEAEKLHLRVLDIRKKVLGEEHPDTLNSMTHLAFNYDQQGRLKEAEELHLRVLDLQKEVLGEAHPNTMHSMTHLAFNYGQQDRLKEAEELHLRVLALREEVLGEAHPDTLYSRSRLASNYHEQGRLQEAEEQLLRVQVLREKGFEAHPDPLPSMYQLPSKYQQGRLKEAES